MQPLKKNDPKRKWRSVKRHAKLLLKTFALSTVITFLWFKIQAHGWHFPENENEIIIGAIIMTFGVTYGVILGPIFSSRLDKYGKVVVAVLEKDWHTLLLYRDERMLIAIHLMLGIASCPLLGMVGAIAYKHTLTGAISVFSVSLVLMTFWLVTAELDNPVKAEWVRERIPPALLTVDIDEYFKIGKGEAKLHDV